MGQGRSKFPISYDEASKRINEEELARLDESFKRWASNTGYLPQVTFQKDVLTDVVPQKLSEAIFSVFQGSQKGIAYKDLVCGIVLLTHGKPEEKRKFIFNLVAGEGKLMDRKAVETFVVNCNDVITDCQREIDDLFGNDEEVDEEDFTMWLSAHPHFTSLTQWLLGEDANQLKLTDTEAPPSYHQTVAKLTGVTLQDVMDLERKYWSLKTTTRFDLELFTSLVCPPVPKELCEDLFNLFDENGDGNIDFPEMVQGVARCCRRVMDDRAKLCFRLFDRDSDDHISWDEFIDLIACYLRIQEENKPPNDPPDSPEPDLNALHVKAKGLAIDAASALNLEQGSSVSVDQYIVWTNAAKPLSTALVTILCQVCQVIFGLRPVTAEDEAEVIEGYMLRAAKQPPKAGDAVYLIAMQWWERWKSIVKYEDCFKIYPCATAQLPTAGARSKKNNHRPVSSSAKAPTPKKGKDNGRPGGYTTRPQEMQSMTAASPPPTSTAVDSQGVVEMGTEVTTVEFENTVVVVTGEGPAETKGISWENDPRRELEDVDNSFLCEVETSAEKRLINLTNEGGTLRPDIKRGVDYEFIPEQVWRSLTFWYRTKYGRDGPALPRYVVASTETPGLEVELYPVQFVLYKHTLFPPQSPRSSYQTVQVVWTALCTALGIKETGRSQTAQPVEGVAQPTPPSRVTYYRAAFGRNTTVKEISTKLEGLLRVKPDELRLHDYSEVDNPKFLDFEVEGKTVLEMEFRNGHKLLIETRNRDNTWPEELIKALNEAKAKEESGEEEGEEDGAAGSGNKQERKQKEQQVVKVPEGVTGLSNLGNTCFMNSAVQCVSNTAALTQYFRGKTHLREINKSNPLGMGGDMAKRYGDLVCELWKGTSKSIVPLRFRFTIARYAPQFAGFQQQDAQELLAFLLDGLHEDLNRVQNKVYKELRDSDGRPDQEVANEAWNYHLGRNQSIVVDLFHGQLKSELKCRECGYASVRFDPFTFLSLPLPMEEFVEVEVIFVPMNGTGPVRYLFRVDPESKYLQLREILSELCGTPANQIAFMDVGGGIVRTIPAVTSKVRTVLGGWLYAFETPPPSEPHPVSRSESIEHIARRERLNTLSQQNRARQKDQSSGSGGRDSSPRHQVVGQPTENEATTGQKAAEDTLTGVSADGTERDSGADPLHQPSGDIGGEAPQTILDPLRYPPKDPPVAVTNPLQRPPGESGEDPPQILEPLHQPADYATTTPSHHQMSNNTFDNFVIAMHRKVICLEGPYFLAINKKRLAVFGHPVVVPCEGRTNRELYAEVWRQVQRLLSKDSRLTQRLHINSEYPFELKMVSRTGAQCERCPWYKFCSGCRLECNDDHFSEACSYLAIDWEPTTLHLRYQYAMEKPKEHESVQKTKNEQEKPIDVYECLKAFVKEEELGEDDPWYCKQCKEHRPATKKLEIWRLPPILIVHVKRFQFYHSRWIKSMRTVTFPTQSFNPVVYKAGMDSTQVGGTSEGEEPQDAPIGATPQGSCEANVSDNVPQQVKVEVEFHGEQPEVGKVGDREENAAGRQKGQRASSGHLLPEEEGEREAEEGRVSPQSPPNGGVLEPLPPSYAQEVCTLDRLPLYDLYAMTTHYGVLGGGHYVAFAKNPDGQWYHYNDSSCRVTSEDRVETEAPYLLFYQRRGFSFADLASPTSSASHSQRGTSPAAQGGRQEEGSRGPCKVM